MSFLPLMDPRTLLQTNLRLIEGIVARVCRRARIYGADADDFAATVKLKLIEDDYAVLRRFEGRSSLATYLRIVVERWLADETIRDHGRWHPSAEAVRMGTAAVLLESLVQREHRSVDEALPLVRAVDPSLARPDLERMLLRFPQRRPRMYVVDLESAPAAALPAPAGADAELLAREARDVTARAARVLREAMEGFDVEDRMLVRLRFGQAMSIADIARMLRLPQRPLYRRIDALVQKLRRSLVDAAIDAAFTGDVLASAAAGELDLGLDEDERRRKEMPS